MAITAGRRRGRAGNRRRQQSRHRRNSPTAAERQRAPQSVAVQDLHHRRSPHAHERGLQRAAEDARRAAGACEVHLLHDRGRKKFRSRFSRAASGSILPAFRRRKLSSGCGRLSTPKASRPSRRRWSCSPVARPARCATASRCWSNCWRSAATHITVADVHRLLGTAGADRIRPAGGMPRSSARPRQPWRKWIARPAKASISGNCSISCWVIFAM